MSTLEKKLLALAEGKELPWNKIVALLTAYGVLVQRLAAEAVISN